MRLECFGMSTNTKVWIDNWNMWEALELVLSSIKEMEIDEQVETINYIRKRLHEDGPFKDEPVDYVEWVKVDDVFANDYNPNTVAPPEMKLLELSVNADGYTQPIVTWPQEKGREVVDGFHRNRVGREVEEIKARLHGYLPVVSIKNNREDRNDRIASTIRHNRARGKHKVDSMSEIVVELKRRNWSPEKIGRELGMDKDEVLRLTQISGLMEMFADKEFSQAWEADILNDADFDGDGETLD